MSTYNTNCTPCSTTQTVVTPCDGCAMILSDTCVVRKTDAIACLGIAVDDTLHTMIDKIATKICAIDGNNFDTTCLSVSGVVNDTANNAINLLITAVCDAVVTFPTFNTSCLSGGGVGDTLASTINRLISAACATPAELTFALNWTCLSSPVSTNLGDVLQGLVNNIKLNQLSFGSGFTVTPLTSGCGSIVTYNGPGSPGITLTSTDGNLPFGSPASSIIVTGGPTSYNIQPSFTSSTRTIVPSNSVPGVVPLVTPTTYYISNAVPGSDFPTYRYRWDKHVEFDGVMYFTKYFCNYTWLNSWLTSTGTLSWDLFYLPADCIPDRTKTFPAMFQLMPAAGAVIPEGFCTFFNATIIAHTFSGGSTLSLVITDCKDILTTIEAYQAANSTPGLELYAQVWLSQVQYYTI